MTLQADTESKKLHEWFSDLMSYFRAEYEKISDEEKRQGVDNPANYLSPCQVEVFWLKDPELQLIFKSNSRSRPDKEIIIHGPYDSHEFLGKVEPILNEPRWAEAKMGNSWAYADRDKSFAYLLASQLRRTVEQAKELHFEPKVREGRGLGQLVAENTWLDFYFGNIGNSDYVALANEKLKDTVRRAQELKERAEKKNAKPEPATPRAQGLKGYGVYFFPPIMLGEQPELTPADILHGRTNRAPPDPLLGAGINLPFGKHTAVASEDGFIILPISNKEAALKALNVIMAVGMVRGFDFLAVREHELSEVEFNKETMRIEDMTYDPEATMRTRLFLECFGQGMGQKRRQFDEVTLRNIVAEAGKIFDDDKYVEELRLLSEAFTHLNDAEYVPSFVMSWSIIERYISQKWNKWLDENEIRGKRRSKLVNSSQWPVDNQLEVLNLSMDIDDTEYDNFMELKRKRNNLIHKGEQIAKQDAERCFSIAKEIVTRKIN